MDKNRSKLDYAAGWKIDVVGYTRNDHAKKKEIQNTIFRILNKSIAEVNLTILEDEIELLKKETVDMEYNDLGGGDKDLEEHLNISLPCIKRSFRKYYQQLLNKGMSTVQSGTTNEDFLARRNIELNRIREFNDQTIPLLKLIVG